MTTNYLHTLSPKQLTTILRHVQLGHDHLSNKLPRQEYQDLLSIGSLSNNQLERMQSDNQEKLGNVSIVVNTILTSCFGAWLGFNAFNQSSIISIFGILIIICGMGFGLMTGYLSYTLTHYQAKLALKKQQLCNVEQVIVDIIINKRKNKTSVLQDKIYAILTSLDPDADIPRMQPPPNKLIEWLGKVTLIASDKQAQIVITKALSLIRKSLKKLSHLEAKKIPTDSSSFDSSDFLLNSALTNASYIKILTKTDISTRSQIPKIDAWLRKHSLGVLVGLLPTFLGSFASMFVFLNGIPAFFSGIGIDFNFTVTEVSVLKQLALCLALAISLYFAYSHIHSNYKSFKRAKQIEISEDQIAHKTHEMLQLIAQTTQWSKIYDQLQLIHTLAKKAINLEVDVLNTRDLVTQQNTQHLSS